METHGRCFLPLLILVGTSSDMSLVRKLAMMDQFDSTLLFSGSDCRKRLENSSAALLSCWGSALSNWWIFLGGFVGALRLASRVKVRMLWSDIPGCVLTLCTRAGFVVKMRSRIFPDAILVTSLTDIRIVIRTIHSYTIHNTYTHACVKHNAQWTSILSMTHTHKHTNKETQTHTNKQTLTNTRLYKMG